MSRRGYTALPNSRRASISDKAKEEMDDAFESDGDDDVRLTETAPLTQQKSEGVPLDTSRSNSDIASLAPGYDFENLYDHPPPGSPPPMPISINQPAVGNTNGIIPSPPAIPTSTASTSAGSQSFFRRAVGVLLPTHYARVPTSDSSEAAARARGSGIENDGVFSNVAAKPMLPRAVLGENGEAIHVMPEESQKDAPPSYAAAQADAVPPYWETTVHAPHFGSDDILIDGLPSGSVLSFASNFMVSMTFQYVGFMLTYLMHTTHAAKYGSRAGLGVTLIQYGLFSRDVDDSYGSPSEVPSFGRKLARRVFSRSLPDLYPLSSTAPESASAPTPEDDAVYLGSSAHDWVTFLLMTAGWFLLLSSVLGYARVKRWERGIRSSTPPAPLTPEEIALDAQVRARIQAAFGIDTENRPQSPRNESHVPQDPPSDQDDRDLDAPPNARIMRLLRESGFL